MTKVWWADLPDEVLTETAWERQMNLAGIELFERSRMDSSGKARDASETQTGQKMVRNLVARASVAVEDMQRAVVAQSGRRELTTKSTTLLLPADSASMLTLRAIIDRSYSAKDPREGYNYQILVKEVSRSIEVELNFRNWIKTSKKAAEAYAKANGLSSTPQSQAERILEESGLSRSGIWRWKKAFKELNEYRWDSLEQHYCGDALICAVVEALPEFFTINIVRTGFRTIKHVKMSDSFREKFDLMESRLAQMQVTKKPMIARPKPWTETE